MTYEELGRALAEARTARRLSLHDVERDTRISTKYLKALEAGRLEELPAPVYARAFMRTYAQYLGLNAAGFVQRLPGARPEPELPPLPEVGREATASPLSASWIIAGVVVVLLFTIGLVLFWSRGGDGEESVTVPPTTQQTVGQGAEAPSPPPDQLRPTVVVEPGVVPDVVDENVLVAIAALRDAGIPYLVIAVDNDEVPDEVVFDQRPSAQTDADPSTVVTLMVSRG